MEHVGLIREELSDIYSFCWWVSGLEKIVGSCHGFFSSPDLREKLFSIYFIWYQKILHYCPLFLSGLYTTFLFSVSDHVVRIYRVYLLLFYRVIMKLCGDIVRDLLGSILGMSKVFFSTEYLEFYITLLWRFVMSVLK